MSDTGTEREQLLPTSQGSQETPQPATEAEGDWALAPDTKDRVALGMIGVGIALFLPLTWYVVLRQDLKALGYFAPHPPLQSLAITAFLLGITPLQPPTPAPPARAARFKLHQRWMLGLALPALAVGTASMWWNKHVHGAKHFTTWHSWFGAATVVWVLLQSILGSATVWAPNLFGGPGKAKAVYKYHRASGYLLVLLALSTAHLGGAHSDWALSRPGGEMKWVRVGAYWIGLPLIALGLLVRMRYVQRMNLRPGLQEGDRELMPRPSKMQFF